METCDQCKAAIPESETPCVFEDRLVCAACHRALGGAVAVDAPAREEVIFEREGKVVTSARVADAQAGVELRHLYSARVEPIGFQGSIAVVVSDTRRQPRRFIFATPANAADFIAAIKRLRRLLIVEPENWQEIIAAQKSPA